MVSRVDANALPNDKFGYRIYGVMAHLPDEQAAAVRRFHHAIGADSLATRPHCSVHNFYGPDDLDDVRRRLGEVATRHRPFTATIDLDRLNWWGTAITYIIESAPQLMALHDDVVASLADAVQLIYPADSPYHPHSTILLEGSEDEIERAREAVADLRLEPEFPVESFELIGRIGPSRGGEYRVLESFPLTGT